MALVVPNEGENKTLSLMLNKTNPEDLILRLYTNNKVPSAGDSISSFVEASGSGYAANNLVANDWVIESGDPTIASYPQVTFGFTGSLGDVYGYYVTQETSNVVMFAEKFSNGPFNIQNSGDEIRINLRFVLTS